MFPTCFGRIFPHENPPFLQVELPVLRLETALTVTVPLEERAGKLSGTFSGVSYGKIGKY
jgi:hypothetical protein